MRKPPLTPELGHVMRWLTLAAVLILAPLPVLAQTCPPQSTPAITGGGSVFGAIVSQWKQFFAAKADANNGTLCNPTIVGTIIGATVTADEITAALGYTP